MCRTTLSLPATRRGSSGSWFIPKGSPAPGTTDVLAVLWQADRDGSGCRPDLDPGRVAARPGRDDGPATPPRHRHLAVAVGVALARRHQDACTAGSCRRICDSRRVLLP